MEPYVVLNMDERVKRRVHLEGFTKEELNSRQPLIKETDTAINWIYADYIRLNQMFHNYDIFSDKVKEVFEMYHKNIYFQPIILTDALEKTQRLYWNAKIEELDCLVENTVGAGEFVLNKDKLENKHIFTVKKDSKELLVVSIFVAESMIRRHLTGIRYDEIL